MPDTKLHRAIYVSRATAGCGDFDDLVEAIVAVSRRNNARVGVTGLLLASGGAFIQVLEGPRRALSERLVAIARDPRHQAMDLLGSGPVDGRLFGRWTMMARSVSPDAAELLDAMNGYGAFDATRLDGPSALRLLLTMAMIADGRPDRPPQQGAA